jgi:type IV secretory pathway TrbD component
MSLEVIHKSLHRPQLFLGVDRELAMYTILISIITAAGGYNLISLITAIVFFFVSMRYLRLWAKKDPFMRDVFMRYIRYVRKADYYCAKPSAFSKPNPSTWKTKKMD